MSEFDSLVLLWKNSYVAVRERLDKILVEKGLSESRERARALVMEGKVLVDGQRATKAGTLLGPKAAVALSGEDIPFVSRGGLKLDSALNHFQIDVRGKNAIDIGASTGGFTDCLLQRGAAKVYAIDVGYGQFSWRLRNDPRVVLIERTNIRHLKKDAVKDEIDFAAIDVSFISLNKVLPKAVEIVKKGGWILALVKPQFEVGKGEVGKGGIVREEAKRLDALRSVSEAASALGLECRGVFKSPVEGRKGNIEYFIFLRGAE